MQIAFTEEERKWIKIKPFSWDIEKSCPKTIEKTIREKMRTIKTKKVVES